MTSKGVVGFVFWGHSARARAKTKTMKHAAQRLSYSNAGRLGCSQKVVASGKRRRGRRVVVAPHAAGPLSSRTVFCRGRREIQTNRLFIPPVSWRRKTR